MALSLESQRHEHSRKPSPRKQGKTTVSTEAGQFQTVRKVVVLLGGMLERAVEWGRIPANPVRAVRKPPDKRRRTVRPVAPITVEQLRTRLLGKRQHRDAVLVSVLAYAGLRPAEALALTWSDIRRNAILVDKAIALGEVQDTKSRRSRAVGLLGPLAADLAEWKLVCARPDPKELVFRPPMANRGAFTTTRTGAEECTFPQQRQSGSTVLARTTFATASAHSYSRRAGTPSRLLSSSAIRQS
jgi:integrase